MFIELYSSHRIAFFSRTKTLIVPDFEGKVMKVILFCIVLHLLRIFFCCFLLNEMWTIEMTEQFSVWYTSCSLISNLQCSYACSDFCIVYVESERC